MTPQLITTKATQTSVVNCRSRKNGGLFKFCYATVL